MPCRSAAAAFLFSLIFGFLGVRGVVRAEGEVRYNRDVRPILSAKCFACHGMDAAGRNGDLRLDVREEAVREGKHGIAVVPGNLEQSLAWQRILSGDPDEVMPPPESHKVLEPEEKETLARWIRQGAPYEAHWSFVPPAVDSSMGSKSIDGFLEMKHGTPGEVAGEASREVLIRRVSLALTGLPPSRAQLEQYLADHSPDAYSRMVDQYLQTPAYGEEMARHWLDVARYADTHGLHLDNERQMWAYRDWVVAAFNRNQPFDQFTVEQLAGDLLPEPTPDQWTATGFNRCNVTTGEGGSIDAEQLFRYAVDRASTTAQTWLGLTIGCAACHDHKYDPISQKEFYSFYAFFHSNADPALDGNALLTQPVFQLKPPGYSEKTGEFRKAQQAVQDAIELKARQVTWQDPWEQKPRPGRKTVEQIWMEDEFPAGAAMAAAGIPGEWVSSPAPVFSGSKSLKRTGEVMGQDYYTTGAQPILIPEDGVLFLHIYTDPADPPEEVMIQLHTGEWRHRAWWGQDLIPFGEPGTGGRYGAGGLPQPGLWTRLEVEAARLGLQPGDVVQGLALTAQGGTVFLDRIGIHGAVDPSLDPAKSFTAWRDRMALTGARGVPEPLQTWLKEGGCGLRTDSELQQLRTWYWSRDCTETREQFAAERAEQTRLRKAEAEFEASIPSTFVYRDLVEPRPSFVMKRGQYDQPGEAVVPATPAVLPALAVKGPRATRLDLARWLTAPENPLTARVTVNRFWQQLFGVGLVETSHDFGTQGSLPSHPELLDWLSVTFQNSGWDVKALMRQIVHSHAFRRNSSGTPAMWQEDPQNRFLRRGPRLRLDAEPLRDQALFVSGLLQTRMGGRGVNPYQPENIWEPLAFTGSNTRNYVRSQGPDLHRRSLYTFYKRTAPAPFLVNFDAPSREQTCSRRERSNTPLQALQLMNDVQHFEAARALAEQALLHGGPSNEGRLSWIWRSVLCRFPSATESQSVLAFQQSRLSHFRDQPQLALQVIHAGTVPPNDAFKVPELAAWTLVANLVLNLDEAITRN